MIKDVKKILEKRYGVDYHPEDHERVAEEICQLFEPKPKHPPELDELIPEGAIPVIQKDMNGNEYLVGYWNSEPKPDEGRLQKVGNTSKEDYCLACVLCGVTDGLTLTAHRNQLGKVCGWLVACIKCQESLHDFNLVDAKTASILKKKYEADMKHLSHLIDDVIELEKKVKSKDAECQERVDKLIASYTEYIEARKSDLTGMPSRSIPHSMALQVRRDTLDFALKAFLDLAYK